MDITYHSERCDDRRIRHGSSLPDITTIDMEMEIEMQKKWKFLMQDLSMNSRPDLPMHVRQTLSDSDSESDYDSECESRTKY
jgi:hypothetical protein